SRVSAYLLMFAFVLSLPRPPPYAPPFPYTTLFRSLNDTNEVLPPVPGAAGALPLSRLARSGPPPARALRTLPVPSRAGGGPDLRSEEHTAELPSLTNLGCPLLLEKKKRE